MKIIELTNVKDFDGLEWVNIINNKDVITVKLQMKAEGSNTIAEEIVYSEEEAKQLFKIHFGGGAEWSDEDIEGTNVVKQAEDMIQTLETLSKTEGIYDEEKIKGIKAAQYWLIQVFGRKDIRSAK